MKVDGSIVIVMICHRYEIMQHYGIRTVYVTLMRPFKMLFITWFSNLNRSRIIALFQGNSIITPSRAMNIFQCLNKFRFQFMLQRVSETKRNAIIKSIKLSIC